MIEVKGLVKRFGDNLVLDHITESIHKGEKVVIVGPSDVYKRQSRMLLESFETLNSMMGATILMVTHDAFAASYCKRILFIKDGKIFNELVKGNQSRKEFFNKIIEVVTLLGGDNNNVL